METKEKILEEIILNNLSHKDIADVLALVIAKQKKEIEKLNDKLNYQATKIQFYDEIMGNKNCIPFADAAMLCEINAIVLSNILREHKIFTLDNIPDAAYIDDGYFRTLEIEYRESNREIEKTIKILVSVKGINLIRKIIAQSKNNN